MPKRRKVTKVARARGRSRARRGRSRRAARAAARRRAQLALAKQRSAAAYKGQITRLKKQLAARPAGPAAEAGATVIFQSPTDDDAEPVFKPIDEYRGLAAVTWQADLLWIHQGVTIAQERLPFPGIWEQEALGATFRRQAKAWIDQQKTKHPELGDESPAAGVVRIALAGEP